MQIAACLEPFVEKLPQHFSLEPFRPFLDQYQHGLQPQYFHQGPPLLLNHFKKYGFVSNQKVTNVLPDNTSWFCSDTSAFLPSYLSWRTPKSPRLYEYQYYDLNNGLHDSPDRVILIGHTEKNNPAENASGIGFFLHAWGKEKLNSMGLPVQYTTTNFCGFLPCQQLPSFFVSARKEVPSLQHVTQIAVNYHAPFPVSKTSHQLKFGEA